jgi:hypothetical protein
MGSLRLSLLVYSNKKLGQLASEHDLTGGKVQWLIPLEMHHINCKNHRYNWAINMWGGGIFHPLPPSQVAKGKNFYHRKLFLL